MVDRKVCPICGKHLKRYFPYGDPLIENTLCPYCGSQKRHRALWLYLEKTMLFKPDREIKVIHFSPEYIFQEKFREMSHIDYYPVDADPRVKGIRDIVDIQNLQYDSHTFDVVLTNHVLEHIPDDKKAMMELSRILKDEGVAYITVPIADIEQTLENPEFNTPELRKKHYWQEDHLRLYGKDFAKRLEDAGFFVEVVEPNKEFTNDELSLYGIIKEEKIFKCIPNKKGV